MLKDNINVGDYVRTHDGRIDKIVDIKNDFIYIENSDYGYRENYLKSSPNIIDLIEYCDIVKYKIDDEEFISEVWGEKNNYFVQNFDVPIDLRDLNIVSIVTKEQFESMEYKIER